MITDPYAIFAAAQKYWQSAAYPQHLSYGITITVTRENAASYAHYHATYDTAQNRVSVNPVSDEELAHPYTPHGINTFLNLFGGSVPLSSPQQTFDYLGVPVLAPNYAFGIVPRDAARNTAELGGMDFVRQIREEFHDPFPPHRHEQSGDLKTIAMVVVAHRQYDIRLAGTQPLAGHADYHLMLKPVSDPATYRLREMWVDTATYATDRVVSEGNFTADDFSGVRWQTDFRQIDGATFIATETALSAFTLDRRHYDSATVAFTGIAPTQNGTAFSSLPRFATNAQTAPPLLQEPEKPPV